MEQPKISIIIPVFNSEQRLQKCLESILAQKYQNLEIILINDGSTDQSAKICDSFSKKDQRIEVFHQQNKGASSARNYGISRAKGDYIVFIDSDDEVAPDFLEKLLDKVDQYSLVVTNICRKDLNNHKETNVYQNSPELINNSKTAILKSLLKDGRLYPVVNKIFRADIIRKYNIRFDENMNFAEDLHFVLNYLKYANKKILFNKEPLYIYNISSSGTVRKTSKSWRNWQKSYEQLKKWVGKNPAKKEQRLLKLIYLRWKTSYLLAKIRK